MLTTRGYTSKELELALDKKPIVLTAYQENGEWTLLSVSYDTTLTSRDLLKYSQITFSFTFQRRSSYHVMTTIIPMFLLAFLSCYVFKLPVDAGEKLGYCLTVLLAFAVYLTLVSDNIPTTSTTVCYLCKYKPLACLDTVGSSLFEFNELMYPLKSSYILIEQTNYPRNYIPKNQNFDNPRTLASTNK